ncbi:hypothetical protein [Acinetobacter haemolyticus]|nr:hypothetical protein [Acinetobacter haemolyticus]
MDKGFDGMKWLTIWFFASTLFFGFWLGHFYATTPIEELKAQKKKLLWEHIKVGVMTVVVLAMATGLNKKVAILFLDIDGYVTELKEAKVIMRGGVKANLNRFSGTSVFPVMDVNNVDKEATPVCDLILKDKCQYGYMMDQGFDIQYVDDLKYPLKYRYLIFEIKSPDFYRGIDYHVHLYKTNQRYVWYLIFFTIIPALIFVFLIPYLLFLNQQRKNN